MSTLIRPHVRAQVLTASVCDTGYNHPSDCMVLMLVIKGLASETKGYTSLFRGLGKVRHSTIVQGRIVLWEFRNYVVWRFEERASSSTNHFYLFLVI